MNPVTGIDEAPELAAFLAQAEERGCTHESEIEELVARLELDDAAVSELRERLASSDVDVADDCGREAPATAYADGDLAHYTVDAMTQFLAEASRYPLLTAAEELELAKRIERGDLEAKERLIAHNLRLVVSIAKRYPVSTQMPLIDLVQEGTLGLIRAAEKFDWRKGFRFSTYATLWIRQAIGRGVAQKSRGIRLPHDVEQRERKVALARARLSARLGREPTDEEVAGESSVTVEQVRELAAAPRIATSLDRPISGEDDTSVGTLVPADLPELGDELHVALGNEAVRRAVAGLTEPARSVLRLRYGLNGDGEPRTYAAITRHLGLEPSRVRSLEEQALRELARRRELEALREAA